MSLPADGKSSGGFFDLEGMRSELKKLNLELEDSNNWSNHALLESIGKTKAILERQILAIESIELSLSDLDELITIADASDQSSLAELKEELRSNQKIITQFELNALFTEEEDRLNAYIDIQSGSGGTEAQDWAEMLLRMYQKFCDSHPDLECSITSTTPGEVAGIKNATLHVKGLYAFGYLKTESGVHRLVRKSPFDSGNRRHTSFASVFISPEVDENIEISISPSDIRIDTYRASGAGGQHVNTTDSAVRITHVPTGIVTQCQNERSQHQNKAQAMNMLRSRLYQVALDEKMAVQKELEQGKDNITWGQQIRSYTLDQSRIKDLRTGLETRNTQGVLNGDLMPFIEASLHAMTTKGDSK
tara:strand:- start:4624 stop:5706 length:1083 start_codon:yes stop_codon:yes gene_type:complete